MISENKRLQSRIEELLVENTRLEEQLKKALMNAQQEEDVGCADVRKSV